MKEQAKFRDYSTKATGTISENKVANDLLNMGYSDIFNTSTNSSPIDIIAWHRSVSGNGCIRLQVKTATFLNYINSNKNEATVSFPVVAYKNNKVFKYADNDFDYYGVVYKKSICYIPISYLLNLTNATIQLKEFPLLTVKEEHLPIEDEVFEIINNEDLQINIFV